MEIVEKVHPFGFVISKANLNRSLDNAVLLSGQDLDAGTVLGKTVTAGTVTGAAGAGNTGNGTIGTLSVGGAAKEGVYKAVMVEPAANAGAFVVFDPDGVMVGRGTVAVAFTGAVNFTIADGGTDFVAGDFFNIKVSQLTTKWKVLNPAGTDGSEVAAGILGDTVDASAADAACVVLTRDAEVNSYELTWPDAIAADDKSIAISQLAKLGIIVR